MERRGFGRLRKRANGRWQAGYIGPDAALHYAPETFTVKMDAEGWLRDESRRIEADDWQPPADRIHRRFSRGVTFREYAEPWLMERDLKPTTRAHYRKLLDLRLLETFGEIPMRSITRARVEAWHQGQGKGLPR